MPVRIEGSADFCSVSVRSFRSHRPAVGRFILFARNRILRPMTHWLFAHSEENFRRRDRLNRVLLACIEELALGNARLRPDLQRR